MVADRDVEVRRSRSRHRQLVQRALRGARRRRPGSARGRAASNRDVQNAAGERFGRLDVESSPYFTAVTDDPRDALATAAQATGIAAEVLRDHPNVLIGSLETVAEMLYSRRESLGVNYVTVQQNQIESFAPVVERLHGR